MSARQLELFRSPRPLVERLGEELFRSAPRCPGVYIMADANGQVLYVGQSGNLRSRLASYKNARPGHAARKTIRLIHAVHSIVWEICKSADEAQLRENELLRRHRPKFNSVNTYPPAYWYIWLRHALETLELGRSHELVEGVEIFGAFKGGVVPAFAATLRLLWAGVSKPVSLSLCPIQLSGNNVPAAYRLELPPTFSARAYAGIVEDLRRFLQGASCALVERLGSLWVPASAFDKALQTNDLETLKGFYSSGPEANHEMVVSGAVSECVVPRESLDDLLVIRRSGKSR